jgi:NAD(P)-dependent dehydrogenase (short-subunit alcohol dehydrogenase family)
MPTDSNYSIDFGLSGRAAVVTGAAQGIGQAIAAAFAHAGADVALVDLDEPRMAETAGLVEAAGQRALPVAVDIGDRAAVFSSFDRIVSELGQVDVLVNCAAVLCENLPAEQASEEDMDRLWQINVKGTFACAQAASANMIERRRGSIVNLASQAAIVSLPNQSIYTATKGAVAALTRSLAIDWAQHGINVNAIAPTFVWTPMSAPMLEDEAVHAAAVRRIPLGRIGRPQDIAGAALFLASDAGSHVTGHMLPVDGGWTAGEPELPL